MLEVNSKDIENIHIIGDRVLIKPKTSSNKTKSGLYLPPTVKEKEKAQLGYIIKVGPGYPIPALHDEQESWRQQSNETKYIPLQVKEGDLAVFLNNSGIEVELNNEKYIVIQQSSILMIVRDEDLFS